MSYPKSNGFGCGQNWYFNGFGAKGNDQQPAYHPRGQSNALNILSNGQNVVYRGHVNQEQYDFRNNINVFYPTNANYNPAFQQNQPQFNHPQHCPQQVVHQRTFYPQSEHGIHQNQTLRDSPMNFCVPNSNTTQTTNNDEAPIGGVTLMDISSSHQNSTFCSNQTSPKKNKSLLEMTDEELAEDLKDWNPDFLEPVIFTQIPLEQYEVMEINNGNIQVTAPSQTHSSSSSTTTKTTTTGNPVGRPPTYKTEEERQEAHRIASRKHFSKKKNEKAEYRQGLENSIFDAKTENENLRQSLAAWKNRFVSFFNQNSQFLSEEERNYALRMHLQMFQN